MRYILLYYSFNNAFFSSKVTTHYFNRRAHFLTNFRYQIFNVEQYMYNANKYIIPEIIKIKCMLDAYLM